MERKKTMTMNWDGLRDDDDDDRFFESVGRRSSAMPEDLASSSDDEDFEDSRMSFSSVVSTRKHEEFRAFAVTSPMTPEYDIWMAAPGSINARRKRLLEGMGLNSGKQFLRDVSKKIENNVQSKEFQREPSKKIENNVQISQPETTTVETPEKVDQKQEPSPSSPSPSPSQPQPPPLPIMLVRSRSDGDIDAFSISKSRKDDLIGNVSKQRLTRTYSMIMAPSPRMCNYPDSIRVSSNECGQSIRHGATLSTVISNRLGAFVLIKNLDTGKEFVVKGSDQDGMWNRLSDLETGKQLTMEEFEKCVGYSPVVKEMMQRENGSRMNALKSINVNSYFSKSLRMSKRRGAALLKNIKGSMTGIIGEKEMSLASLETKPSKNGSSSAAPPPPASEQWVKVRQSGRSYKELSALHFCQEIQAHEGSIWTMKFSPDARLLASAGEDRTIHVWEVQECEVMSMKPNEEGSVTPIHPSFCNSPDRSSSSSPAIGDASALPSEKRKKGKGGSGRKGSSIPDYVHVPESGFSLSEKPVTSFNGHQEDVLDLSWSSDSQRLLSSSMDKTVRLWDMETKNCLKVFAHNDYVTCIQFNPVDDNHFISGALDSKVRIWNIPDRYVVDWTDLHEMITAACYSPDGQGAIIGSHKGSCRMYTIEDSKLEQKHQVDVQSKKSNGKKITGFQFVPGSTTEVLVTSADSRIRILDGTDVTQRFRGFRNTSSQLAASFSQDGKYVVCASEDSQVFVWKREEPRNTGSGRKSLMTAAYRGHEHFPCKDVSVAIAWPGTISGEPPMFQMGSKRHSKRVQPQTPSAGTSPTRDENSSAANAKKVQLPPLPKKNNNNAVENNNDNKNNNENKNNTEENNNDNKNTPEENNNDNKNTPEENNNDNKNNNLENNNDNKNNNLENNNDNKNNTVENNNDNKNNTVENNDDDKNNTGENNNDDKNNTGEKNNDDKNNKGENNHDDKNNTGEKNNDDKNNKRENNNDDDNNNNTSSPPDEEQQQQAQVARSDSKAGDSPSISSAAAISNNSSSSSWSSSWSWPFDVGNSHGHHAVPATAWGLVIVTAGLGGEIRVYQNFGLPRRIGRQANFWPAT